MGFFSYIILGGIAFAIGRALRSQRLDKRADSEALDRLTHPVMMSYLAGFFGVMVIVSWLLGRFVLAHPTPDWAFIIVNSLVATFVFSFGLSPEKSRYDVPD